MTSSPGKSRWSCVPRRCPPRPRLQLRRRYHLRLRPAAPSPMPIVALVGRPNVGKSTLFNRLIGEHRAVVHEQPGTTRDRLYGTAEWRNREFTVIDTGGIGLDTGEGDLLADVRLQAEEAMREADVIVWVVDASSGLTAADDEVAQQLRPSKKPV